MSYFELSKESRQDYAEGAKQAEARSELSKMLLLDILEYFPKERYDELKKQIIEEVVEEGWYYE